MAYIRKLSRKKGTVYRAEIAFDDGSKKSRSFRVKEEAQIWARGEEDARASEKSFGISSVRMTVDEYFEKWMTEYATYHHSAGWLTSDRSMYRLHVQPVLGRLMIREVQSIDITRVLREIRAKGQAASSANRIRQLLSKMFNEAVTTYRYIPFNPVSAVRPFKELPKQIEYLREGEAKALMGWADSQPLGLAIHLALHLGLREGEIIGLKWDAVDLTLHRLDVRRKWEKKTKTLEEFAKGKKIRTLGIPQQGILERLWLQRERYPVGEFVVCNDDQKMIHPMDLFFLLRKGIEATGIRKITVHGLRHSFASLYMQKGGDLYDLQKLMGHENVRTTERYRHSDPDYLRERCRIVDLYSESEALTQVRSAQIPPKTEKLILRLVKN